MNSVSSPRAAARVELQLDLEIGLRLRPRIDVDVHVERRRLVARPQRARRAGILEGKVLDVLAEHMDSRLLLALRRPPGAACPPLLLVSAIVARLFRSGVRLARAGRNNLRLGLVRRPPRAVAPAASRAASRRIRSRSRSTTGRARAAKRRRARRCGHCDPAGGIAPPERLAHGRDEEQRCRRGP